MAPEMKPAPKPIKNFVNIFIFLFFVKPIKLSINEEHKTIPIIARDDVEKKSKRWKNIPITDEKINYPIDTYDLLNHYSFESREELEEFIHRDYSYQIFAKAEMIPRTMDAANFLQIFGNSTNLFDVVIVAKCKDSSIISTNHFLSKHASKIKNIKFIDEHEDIWNFCDVVISDCPEVFETKPKGKKSVKINHMYNEYSEADYSFDSINDIKSEEFIKKLFK